jgi:lipopolysaccharide transport system permease protein
LELVLAAVLPWQFFSAAVSESSGSLVSNSNLISKVYFPRLIIPFAAAVTSLVDFIITLFLLAIVMLWYSFVPNWHIVLLPLFVLLTYGVSMGVGLFMAALNVEYRDFRFIVPFIIQFGLFVTPVAFSSTDVPEKWRTIFSLNPLVGIIDGFRWCILGGTTPLEPGTVVISILVMVASLTLGIWYFRRMERNFADVI